MSERWFWLVLLFLTGWLVHLLSPILTPFIIAILLAYIGDPLVDRLEQRYSRTVSVITVFLSLSLSGLLILIILIPKVEQQLSYLISMLPQYLSLLHQFISPYLAEYFGIELTEFDMDMVRKWIQTQYQQDKGAFESALNVISSSGMTILNWVMNLLLIPVVTFYMLRDWDKFVGHVHNLIPRRYEDMASRLARGSTPT